MADKPPIKEDLMVVNRNFEWHLFYTFAKEQGFEDLASERYVDKMILKEKNSYGSLYNRYNDNGSSLGVDLNTTIVGS